MTEQNYPPNFSRAEMLVSSTASRHGVSNEPATAEIEANIASTAWKLQGIREALAKHYGRTYPIRIFSVYRSLAVNNLVGGSKSSAHMRGMAADIIVPGLRNRELAAFLKANVVGYDQIILEFPDSPSGGWVHIGWATRPRGQLLTASKQGGVTVYKTGLA